MVDVRRIKPEERDQVRDLITSVMQEEFPQESPAYEYRDLDDVLAHYSGDRETFLVAEQDGAIIGTVAIKEDGPDTALLRRIFVHKDYRGRGYGKRLLRSAMEFCFERQYKNVTFRGTDRMQNALQLCLKSGFEEQDVAELGDFNLILLAKKL